MGRLRRFIDRIFVDKILYPKPRKKKRSQGFQRFKSKAWRKAGKVGKKVLFYTFFTSAIAIGGANLGTYFSYKYHNHDYRKFPNRTKIEVRGPEANDPLGKLALEAVKLRIVGAAKPEEAKLDILLIRNKGNIGMEATYTMVWNTNKGVRKRDVEMMDIRWRYDSKQRKFIPVEAQTRYHYKTVKLPLSGRVPAIVIQNPAHTPGIPGAQVSYRGPIKVVDVFTLFSAEKWAGSSLSCNLPHKFRSLYVVFKTKIDVVKKIDHKTTTQPSN